MSGIAGLVRLDGRPVHVAQIQAMLLPMQRRGPDRQRALALANAGFGQALLATTAEAQAERQPWVHADTGCIVVSDSRLDNRTELVAELGLARPADHMGDGELLHAAWQRWGDGCADRLRGDFAFALWDPQAKALFCARDIMGVRPFYFHYSPGRLFAFASDVDALLALPDVPRRINEGRIGDALMGDLEGIDRTSTFFLDIERLPPARTLAINANGARQAEYWNPLQRRPHDLPVGEAEWIEAVRDALQEAVHCRLRGSTRVGSMVSGGLDSSSAAVLAQRLLPDGVQLPVFSAINSLGPCAETAAARAVLAAYPFQAHTVDLQHLDALEPALHAHLEHLGEPFDGGMTLVSAVYAQAAAAGVRAVLDGMPADNLYSAGGLFHGLARSGQWPRLLRQATLKHRRDASVHPRLRALRTMLGSLLPAPVRQRWEARQHRAQYRADLVAARIAPAFAQRVDLPGRYRRYRLDMARTRLGVAAAAPQSIMTAAYITAAVERYNRVASFHGIEPRPPFLDRRVIELHAWLPLDLRLRDGYYKWALRAAMRGLLPDDVAWRRDKNHLGHLFNARLIAQWQQRHGSSLRDPLDGCLTARGKRATAEASAEDWMAGVLAEWLRER